MKNILVIEDDRPVRAGIVAVLRRQGYGVLDTDLGAEGLSLALAHGPDLILSDINLPGLSGLDMLKQLRARPEIAAIPVILMTGEPHKTGARSSMTAGADDFLPKPFSMDQMLATVRARLERQNNIQHALDAQNQAEIISVEEKIRLQTSALEAAANGIAITDRSGKIRWVNPAFTKLTGYTSEEAVGQNPRVLKSGQHPHKFYADLWATISAGNVWHGDLINKRKDGSLYFEEMTITPVRGTNGGIQNYIAIKHDVTERKEVEQALAHERDLLQTLMDNLPDLIYFKDLNSRFTRINRAHARHLGLQNPEIAVGKTDADFFPVHLARQKLVDESRLLATGQPILGLVEKSDTATGAKWVSSTKVPIYGTDGKVTGLVGISRDITESKRTEEEQQRMEVELRQSQKLESIGQLAAGIVHEINTPTQHIGDNTRFVKDSFDAIVKILQSHEELLAATKANAITPELLARADGILAAGDLNYLRGQIPQALDETLEGVERVSKIVRAMKEFSHPGGKEETPADLNKAIESTVTVARNEWK